MERPRSLEHQSASAVDCLLGNKKSGLSHLNSGTNGARLALHTGHCGLKESRVRDF